MTRRAKVLPAVLLLLAGRAAAQVDDAGPVEVTESGAERVQVQAEREVSPAVLRRLEAPFLTPEEGRALRVFHGLWREEDLATPALRAQAALIIGAWGDPALGAGAPPQLRAEAMLARGELEGVLDLLAGEQSPAAMRLRAEALHGLGRMDEALALAEAGDLSADATAEDLVEGVRLLALRARLREPGEGEAAGRYRALLAQLGRARNALDRLDWRVRLAEAEILLDKGNRPEAQAALREVLALNPRSAQALALLGEMAVGAFAFDDARQIADELDALAGGVSAPASEIRARAALRQGDAEGAAEALAPALEVYPRRRELLALHAAAAARGHDLEEARARLAALDALGPGTALGWMEVGRALSEARQYDQAREVLTEATRREPAWARPWTELGLMEVQAGRDAAARAALERAFALDPFNIRVDNSLRLVRGLMEEFEVLEGEHFAVRYRPGIDSVLAPEVLAAMEGVHARVSGEAPGSIRHTPRQRTQIELMPDHAWFSVRITGTPQLWTMAAATGPVIAMETPRDGAGQSVGSYDWERVLRHEYVHTVTLDRTNNRIPHWFTEAAAVYLEDAPRDYGRCRLLAEALLNDGLFPLDEINVMFVRPRKPSDRAQAYAQGAWMYEFMIERFGEEAPLRLMDRYAEGWTQARAFEAELGLTPEAFLDAFRPWALEQVRAWGLALPEGVPTLAALIERERAPAPGERRAAGEGLPAGDGAPFELPAEEPEAPAPVEVTDEMVDRWLAEHPEHPEVLELALRREIALWGGDLVGDALGLARRYAAARPVDDLPHRLLAQFYLAGEGRFLDEPVGPEGAIPHLEFLDAREVTSPAYAAELARRYGETGDYARGLAKAQRALRLAPFDADYRELAARLAILAEQWGEAERQILALALLEPEVEQHRLRLEALRARAGGGPG